MALNRWGIKSAYIAGPMRGIPLWNFPAFFEAESILKHSGIPDIRNPARHDEDCGLDPTTYPDLPDWFTLEGALTWDFQQIIETKNIILLDGWETSSGAAKELRVAEDVGARVWRLSAGCLFELTYDYIHSVQAGEQQIKNHEGAVVGEVRVVDPTTGGEKGSKLARFDLVPPDIAIEWAEHYGKGANKYAARNWEKAYAWGLSYAAAQRHLNAFWNGEDFDEETGSSHLIAALWHCAALRWFQLHGKGTDDRSK